MKKKYIIIAVLGVGLLAMGISIFMVSSQDIEDQSIIERATGVAGDPLDESESSTIENARTNTVPVPAQESLLRAVKISLPDFDVLRYAGQDTLYLASTRTGEIYTTSLYEGTGDNAQVFDEDAPREEILRLPETNLEYIFLTTARHMSRHIVYKKEGRFYQYNVSQERSVPLPDDIGYAIVEPSENRLYYITTTNPTEIRSIRIGSTQVTTHITRTGIEWFSVTGSNIMYRTRSTLYRYSLTDQVDILIDRGSGIVSASVSESIPRALLGIDDEILLYDMTSDVVRPVLTDWNLRTVFWQRNALITHTIENSQYVVADFRNTTSIEQFAVDRESLEGVDPQHVFVTGDGTLLFLDREELSIVVYPYYDRESPVEVDPHDF